MFDHHGSTVAVTHSKTGIESLFKVPMAVTLREVHTCIFAIQGLFKIRCFHIKKKKKFKQQFLLARLSLLKVLQKHQMVTS